MDANTLVGAVNMISKAANNMQTEVAENHPSEGPQGRPLLDHETKQDISRPVNIGNPNGTANEATDPLYVNLSNDVPITTEPVQIFSQPTSAVESSDKVADVDSDDEPSEFPCCTCTCNRFHCQIQSCSCLGIDCGHPCCSCVLL